MLKNLELSKGLLLIKNNVGINKKGMSREKAYSLVQNKTKKGNL